MSVSSFRLSALLAGGAFVLLAGAPNYAGAAETGNIRPDPPRQQSTAPADKGQKATKQKKSKKNDKRSQMLIEGYRAAHAIIYQQHDYAGGISKLKSLGADDHPDVANLIGYSSRKLGRYDDAKLWYERALANDPNHARTWSYYGMWHAEQGNLLKARDYLAKVEELCGNKCREYTELKGVIEGTRIY